MRGDCRVSCLIPVYNGAAYVRQAIDSVLAQRDADVEVIVIDDESTDETPAILREYGGRIRTFRQKNVGHVAARNNGARIASGEWLAFLDADDVWLPEKLAKQLAAADDSVGMVYTDRENFGDIARVATVASASGPLHEGDLFEPLLFGNFVTVSSAMMRREWFDRLGGFDGELLVCEDWDMWLRFAAAGGMAAVCREPLTRYRWHPGAMSNNQVRMCEGRLKVLGRALALPRAKRLRPSVARQALAASWRCSAWYAQPGQPWTALRWYLKAACYWPWDLGVYKGMVKCCLRRE
jgi:glycosyltransferase involved in cell wall biosynthesis